VLAVRGACSHQHNRDRSTQQYKLSGMVVRFISAFGLEPEMASRSNRGRIRVIDHGLEDGGRSKSPYDMRDNEVVPSLWRNRPCLIGIVDSLWYRTKNTEPRRSGRMRLLIQDQSCHYQLDYQDRRPRSCPKRRTR
jgi:hypothetical protein